MTASRERFGLRRALVVTQVALSLVLVVCGVLFSRSLAKLLTVDAGFAQDAMLITNIDLTRLKIPVDRRQAFKREMLDRIRQTAGVNSAASTNIVPLSGNAWGNDLWMDGSDSGQRTNSLLSRISPEYDKTLGTSLLAGRDFDDRDTKTSPKVAIVNETFGAKLVEGENPVGKRFWVEATPSSPATLYEIVGLVRDAKYQDLREAPSPVVFLPLYQASRHGEYDSILARANAPMSALISAMKNTLADINPEILVTFQVLKTSIEGSLLRDRLMATLSGFFGGLALLLACIGLYGIMSYGVAGRTNELGIRIALGATRGDVLWLILREALVLVLLGVAIGVPVVLASTKMISSLLYGVTAADLVSICFASLLMFVVAAVAGYTPARRATRIDPMVALRYE
jgi:predicted permease